MEFTFEDLKKYKGPTRYIGIKGKVFDVTNGRNAQMYAEGDYSNLVGRDASCTFVTGDFEGKEIPLDDAWDYSKLDAEQMYQLEEWVKFFDNHAEYKNVGKVKYPNEDPAAKAVKPADTPGKDALLKGKLKGMMMGMKGGGGGMGGGMGSGMGSGMDAGGGGDADFAEFMAAMMKGKGKGKGKDEFGTRIQSTTKPIKPGSADMSQGGKAGPVASQAGFVVIDRDQETTSIQIRFGDGKRQVQEFNVLHTVGTIYEFVEQCTSTGNFSLMEGFPPKPLEDKSKTIKDAGLVKGSVIVKNK